MRVSTLLENTKVSDEFKSAHGLALLIEYNNIKILFDSGPDDSIIHNSKLMGISLEEVDMIVISHGHSDHTGGLPFLLKLNNTAPIYLRSNAINELYSKKSEKVNRNISMPNEVAINSQNYFIKDDYRLSDSAIILSINKNSGFIPDGNKSLYKKLNGELVLDNFDHELILCLKEQDGLVIFTGCSHSGIGNMLATVVDKFPNEKIKAVFGGMHLYNRSKQKSEKPEVIVNLLSELNMYRDCVFYTGHCTGEETFNILEGTLKKRIKRIQTGTIHCV